MAFVTLAYKRRGDDERRMEEAPAAAVSGSQRTMSSCSAVVAVGEQRARAARGGLPRPRRPSRAAPGSAGSPRPGTPRPGSGGSASGRAEFSWWGAGGQAAATPRRQTCGRAVSARVPTGNRELVRRALSPPATRGRGAGALRRWSFRPMPSRLRNVSSFTSSPSPASPRSS